MKTIRLFDNLKTELFGNPLLGNTIGSSVILKRFSKNGIDNGVRHPRV